MDNGENAAGSPLDAARELTGRTIKRPKKIVVPERNGDNGKRFLTYYRSGLVALAILSFLCLFLFLEMMLSLFSFTLSLGNVPASLTPVLGHSSSRLLALAFLMALLGAGLHLRDSKRNLLLSFVPTALMLCLFGVLIVSSPLPEIAFYGVFASMLAVALLDFHCIVNYPKVLEKIGRHRLLAHVENEERDDKLRGWILEEEERVRGKETELTDIRGQLEQKSKLVLEEEEQLHRMETEISALKSDIGKKQQELMEEEETVKAMEEELSNVKLEVSRKEEHLMEEEERIQTMEQELTSTKQELEKRQGELFEEEERIKTKEEESFRIGADYEIQQKFMEELKSRAKLMEAELLSMRGEFERQIKVKVEEEERLRLKKAASMMTSSSGRTSRSVYPFTAIVGQDTMKLALILNAINPDIGGVLIKGQKGTGKSIAIRGLSEILPRISVLEGCRYNCDPSDEAHFCSDCRLRKEKNMLNTVSRPIRVVDLPLNTTEDRLVGSIDIEKVLSEGVRAFEPGLLAESHRGILHVDEINLLDDYVVDILLDSAASGVVAVEREGVSISYPARFIIVGSMNPEEGELRPQLLDRLALAVDVVTLQSVTERVEIVRRMEEFTTSATAFRERFTGNQRALMERITRARALVPSVTVAREFLTDIAKLCIAFKVEGHRADIIIQRAAIANAAYQGRTTVTREDIAVASELTLPHRMKRRGFEKDGQAREVVRRFVTEGPAQVQV